MLDPDYLDVAGDLVGGVYGQIEAELLDHLVSMLLDGGQLDQMGYTALAMIAQTHTEELQAIVDAHQGDIDESVESTVEEYLEAADVEDMARAGGEALWPKQVQATVDGISTVLARDNLQMVDSAKTAFLTASTQAVTRVNTGVMTTEQALHSAVRQLEADGIDVKTVTYRDAAGRTTVTNKVDVAVRRHVRTQIAQDAGRMTETRMESQGIDLVEVSSHPGARPSHAEWQGRCYSRSGQKTIDGVTYRDFDEATGYHGTGPHGALGDRLLGVNCRHSFGPYRHGAPHAYEPDPQSETGLPNDEVYALTQRQRAKERQIREAKRELRGAQQVYGSDKSTESLAAVNAAKGKLRKRQSEMRDLVDTSNARCKPGTQVLHRNPRREWAGDMPDVKTAIKQTSRAKNIELGTLKVASYGKNMDAEVISTISERMTAYEKKYGFKVTQVSFEDLGDKIALQTEPSVMGMVQLTVNTRTMSGKTVPEIDEMFRQASGTVCNSLEDALVHEREHMRLISGKSFKEVDKLYENLDEVHIEGISDTALKDGSECIAETGVLIENGSHNIPEEAIELRGGYLSDLSL